EVGGRFAAFALERAGDFVAFAVPGLFRAPFAVEAFAVGGGVLAPAAALVGAFGPEARLLVVQVEELERLARAHRRDRRKIVAAPGIVAEAFGIEAFEQRHLDPFVTRLERHAHLAREGRIVIAQAVERGMGEAGGAGGEADVGGGGERGEKRLPAGLADARRPTRRRAKLEAAVGEA